MLDRPRPNYKPHLFKGNLWLSAVPRLRRDASEPQTTVTGYLASLHMNEWGASMFPVWLLDEGLGLEGDGLQRRPNLSPAAQSYLKRLESGVEDLFHHVLAVLHDPAYREANAGALRRSGPESLCQAGPRATHPERPRNWPPPPTEAASWHSCWIRRLLSPESPPARSAQNWRP